MSAAAAPLSITPDHVQRARAAADGLAVGVCLSGKRVLAALGLVAMGATRARAAERAGVAHANQLAPSQWHRVGLTDEMVQRIQRDLAGPAADPAPAAAEPPKAKPMNRTQAARTTLRRFESAEIAPEEAIGLRADHPALLEGRSIFHSQVVSAADAVRLLVSGHNNPKLGKEVLKGPRAGWPIFHLTLEERATCPRSCPVWDACYGNAMPFARRHRADDELLRRLRLEVSATAKLYPGGFLVRLHTLGDFFSVEYVLMWAELLAAHPALHVFGYTARREDAPDPESAKIARAVAVLTRAMWSRFAIRTSHAEAGPQRSVVYLRDPALAEVVMCPAQAKATEACATCGLCWAEAARDKAIGFLKHGMKRGRRGRARVGVEDPAALPVAEMQALARKAVANPSVRIAQVPAATCEDGSGLKKDGRGNCQPRAEGTERAASDAAGSPRTMRQVYSPSPRQARRPAAQASTTLTRMNQPNANIVRWSRQYMARGVPLDYLADCFDCDVDALAAATGAAA